MHPPVIFLDIDGVLVLDGKGVPSCHQFLPRCVDALRSILGAVLGARIVFATTWRLPLNVNRLHQHPRQRPSLPHYRAGITVRRKALEVRLPSGVVTRASDVERIRLLAALICCLNPRRCSPSTAISRL